MSPRILVIALLVTSGLAQSVHAVLPDEILDDPALEARARDISRELRCPLCDGESIDDSDAAISRDLRLYVRERLVQGDSDAQAIAAVTDRFGEVVLARPAARGINLLLYLAGPIMAAFGLLIAWRMMRPKARHNVTQAPLSDAEKARIERIMRD